MRRTINYVVMLLLVVTTIGCEKDKQTESLKVSVTNLEVEADDKATFEIISGSGNYSVTVTDTKIATATFSETTVTVNGIKEGETTVIVLDKISHQQVVVKVKIHPYIPLFIDPIPVSTSNEFVNSYRHTGGEIIVKNAMEELYRPYSICIFNKGTEKEYQYSHYQGGNAYRSYVILSVSLNSYYTLASITKWLEKKYTLLKSSDTTNFYRVKDTTLLIEAILSYKKENNSVIIEFQVPSYPF
ncbi:hypothetical protein [Capnocytophaga sp.]|uniref:hypothetical protein n=1 Tax=Capnocytophaga sp. TaxID=44737 RepID=UPI0026DC4970|nr:hypothetical protein [Capnocytophaga sp.]MDO5105818.1 hypothetical protein [Capnocytophaga sp.]